MNLGERRHLLVPSGVKHIFFLPSSYKKRKHTTVAGVASTGEISTKGLVAETEDWEGRIEATAMPATLHLKRLPDGSVVRKTDKEMIEEGTYVLGLGPAGVELVHGGTH